MPVPYGSILHIQPTNLLLLAAKQEPYKKAHLSTKYIEEFFLKKFRRLGQQAEKDKTERVTGLGRKTREKIAKRNQMTALRFQTGGRHQVSPASLWGFRSPRCDLDIEHSEPIFLHDTLAYDAA